MHTCIILLNNVIIYTERQLDGSYYSLPLANEFTEGYCLRNHAVCSRKSHNYYGVVYIMHVRM